MKRALLAIAIGMFIIAGAAQPAMAQQNDTQQAPEEPEDDSDAEEENETQEEEDEEIEESENETEEEEREEAENETEEERAEGESAQFDARLGTAINTLDALVEIAPNDEARNGIQNALNTLRDVQNNTDTASSAAPGESPERPERPDEAEENESEDEQSESQGPPADRGPSQNSNRPGFVNQMLGGLFG